MNTALHRLRAVLANRALARPDVRYREWTRAAGFPDETADAVLARALNDVASGGLVEVNPYLLAWARLAARRPTTEHD